jgi:hypothetical protein
MKIRNLFFGMLMLITCISYGQNRQMARKGKAMDGEMKERIEARLIAFITTELDLSTDEAQDFWPIYNEYREKFETARAENRPDQKKWDVMSDEEAAQLIESRIKMEEDNIALRKQYYNDLKPVISNKKIAKLMMVEREFKSKMLSSLKERMRKNPERRKMREREQQRN